MIKREPLESPSEVARCFFGGHEHFIGHRRIQIAVPAVAGVWRIAFTGDESLTNLWQRRRRRGEAVGLPCFVFIFGSNFRL